MIRTASCCKKCCTIRALCGLVLSSMNIGLSANAWLSKWGTTRGTSTLLRYCNQTPPPSGNASATTHKTSTVDITSSPCSIWLVTWSFGVDYSHMETGPPNAKLPRSAPAVLNGRCRTGLDMSRSSLGVVLWGLPARGRSVTFPVWRKRCISRTMMECFRYLYTHTYLPVKQVIDRFLFMCIWQGV
jgi:hypothetical protein